MSTLADNLHWVQLCIMFFTTYIVKREKPSLRYASVCFPVVSPVLRVGASAASLSASSPLGRRARVSWI